MASIKIPERYQNGLVAILALDDDALEKLISVLQNAPLKMFPPSLSQSIAPNLEDIPTGVLNDIVETLLSLYFTKQHHETPPDSMAEDITNAVQESDLKEFRLPTEDREVFKNRLIRLLSIERLETLSKGLVVLRTSENVFHDARIITEIRPIFGSDPEIAPTAAVILHMLNVTYHREGEMKEFYMALDPDDLDMLRDVIDRAELKAESLRSLLDTAKIAYLDTE
jgi:hypothetical protein